MPSNAGGDRVPALVRAIATSALQPMREQHAPTIAVPDLYNLARIEEVHRVLIDIWAAVRGHMRVLIAQVITPGDVPHRDRPTIDQANHGRHPVPLDQQGDHLRVEILLPCERHDARR